MSPSPSNIAARMGRWSAQHRKKAVIGWLAFVVIAVIAGMQVGMRMLSSTDSLTGESAVAQRILSDAGYGDTADEAVLVQSSTHTVRDPQFRATVRATAYAVRGQMWVSDVRSPLDRGGAKLVSRNGHSALVQFNVRGDMMQTMQRVAPALRAVAGVQQSHEGFRVEEFGTASFGKAAEDSAGKDFSRAEILAIPVTVLILLLAFGAVVAAILLVVLALTAFFAATGLVFIASNVFPIDHSTFSVMLLIGLAVGVDYSLFYIRREREERAAGRPADAALQAAAATSGRSVLISGLTVIVAVAGLFFTGTGEFRGIAAGTMIVVATSVLGSVTVLPALLSKLGDRIETGRVPVVHRLRCRNRESRLWNGVLWGWGEHILGFTSTGGITTWIPLFLFVVLFGISMDYHVFVLSRIREAVDRGMKTEDAFSHGIRTTAGVVTSAAFVMVVVFSIFGSLSTVSMKEIAVGLAVAVLIDATIVRAILLPATMKLLGDWNWWLPRRLRWLPELNPEAASAADIAPATSR